MRKKIISLMGAVITGLLLTADNLLSSISFASLLFQGALSTYIPLGIELLIISSFIIGFYSLLRSSVPHAVALLQDEGITLFTAMMTYLYTQLTGKYSNEAILITFIFFMGLTTLCTGIFFFLMAKFRLAGIIRYLPYPVIGGFLVVTGWLIFENTFLILIDNFSWKQLIAADTWYRWLPPFLATVLVVLLEKKTAFHYSFQLVTLSTLVAFYLGLFLLDISPSMALHSGLMLGPFKTSNNHWFSLYSLWQEIKNIFSTELLSYMLMVIMVSVIAFLLIVTSLELNLNKTIDLNKELRVAGVGNILSGLMGGSVGYLGLVATRLTNNLKNFKRVAVFLTTFLPLLVLAFGLNWLEYVPKMIIGIILFYIALNLFYEWLISTWHNLHTYDYAIIIFIFSISIITNMIIAVGIGIIIAVILFALRYSQVSPIKHCLDGTIFQSSIERSMLQKQILETFGHKIIYIKLQGFLFFGSTYKLYTCLDMLKNVEFVILDFSFIEDIDASRITLIQKLQQLAHEKNIIILICSLNKKLYQEFTHTHLLNQSSDFNFLKLFEDAEKALSWCEEQLLMKYTPAKAIVHQTLEQQLAYFGFSTKLVNYIASHADKKIFQKDEIICQENETADSIYFIHSGQISVYVGHKQIFAVQSGNILGEISFFTDQRRNATLKADQETILYKLSFTFLKDLDPELASNFYFNLASILAKRVAHQNNRVRSFQ